MLRPEHPLAALKRAPIERQGPRRVAHHLQVPGQIVDANARDGRGAADIGGDSLGNRIWCELDHTSVGYFGLLKSPE
jgi:hypothetical protein